MILGRFSKSLFGEDMFGLEKGVCIVALAISNAITKISVLIMLKWIYWFYFHLFSFFLFLWTYLIFHTRIFFPFSLADVAYWIHMSRFHSFHICLLTALTIWTNCVNICEVEVPNKTFFRTGITLLKSE